MILRKKNNYCNEGKQGLTVLPVHGTLHEKRVNRPARWSSRYRQTLSRITA